jgi:hypothetical protein
MSISNVVMDCRTLTTQDNLSICISARLSGTKLGPFGIRGLLWVKELCPSQERPKLNGALKHTLHLNRGGRCLFLRLCVIDVVERLVKRGADRKPRSKLDLYLAPGQFDLLN